MQIVTRDRASSYSSAINKVCPDAIQIADRFHLLMNLSDALDRYLKSISPNIRKLIKDKINETLSMTINGNVGNEEDKCSQSSPENHETINIKIDQRLVTFNKVKKLQATGFSIRKISRDPNICRETVRAYFIKESLSPRNCSRSTNIDLFANHIVNRLNTEGYMVKNIIDELYKLGYVGSRTQTYYNINIIK